MAERVRVEPRQPSGRAAALDRLSDPVRSHRPISTEPQGVGPCRRVVAGAERNNPPVERFGRLWPEGNEPWPLTAARALPSNGDNHPVEVNVVESESRHFG